MIFIVLVLFVAGFLFPPIWLALAGYVIYIFASRQSRRDDAVESRVKKMILSGREHAVFGDLYFEAARSYAIAKGAQSPEHDAASATIIVNGRSYFVTFMRDSGGGTAISARDNRSVENEIERDLQDRLEIFGIPGNHSDPSRFVDLYFSSVDSIGDVDFHKARQRPSWVHDDGMVKDFTSYLVEESSRSGVAETYTIGISLQKEFLNLIFACVATSESQGLNFKFQKDVGVAIIKRGWKKLSEENKSKAREISLDAQGVEILSKLRP